MDQHNAQHKKMYTNEAHICVVLLWRSQKDIFQLMSQSRLGRLWGWFSMDPRARVVNSE